MHGPCTMMWIGQDMCKSLSDKERKGVIVLVFTSAIVVLESLF